MQTTAALNADGFAIVENAVPPERVEELIAAMTELGAGYGLRNLLRTSPTVAQLAQDVKKFTVPWLGDGE